MKDITVKTDSGISRVLLGESLKNVDRYLPDGKVIIITDENVSKHYAGQFPSFPVIRIGCGEENKNLDTVRKVYHELLKENTDRSTFILGVGGGVVCDIAGFVASTFLRGLPFGFVSTSLLSQVDASIGGKNGVNFQGYKNLVGIIRQPRFVICDHNMLDTLSFREYISGFAEILKHAIIRDRKLFDRIETNLEKVLGRDKDLIHELITASVKIKSAVVESDEQEAGLRRVLNYGHTFGHALETLYDLTHGEAISLGMMISNRFSMDRGILSLNEVLRIDSLFRRLHLMKEVIYDRGKVLKVMLADKKKYGDTFHYIMISGIGHSCSGEITLDELRLFNEKLDVQGIFKLVNP
ncbi:MAG: 3-dehydroquinate synthase [Bacteroidales bacterium]|nr:MAG: 3-dehydroquinate synthase [Bacteroidales bacterium]